MPGPFPGMDPYLERYWGDVLQRFITYFCDTLQEKLPTGFFARVQERISVESLVGDGRSHYPDIPVVEKFGSRPASKSGERLQSTATSSGGAVAAPYRIKLAGSPFVQGFIEIYEHALEGKVITIVEVISPSNRLPGKGRIAYRKKQRHCRDAETNLVEIDLLRQGKWILSSPREGIPAEEIGLYGVSVVRGDDEETIAEYYAVRLDQPLPPINIPLRE